MKTPKIVAGIILLNAALSAVAAVVSLPFYDPLNYSEGQLYTVGAGVWDAGGNAGSELTVSNSAALAAPAGLPTAAGKGIRWSPTGTGRRAVVQFTSVPNTDNNTIYASFLLNLQTAPTSTKLIGFLESSTSSTTSPQLGIFVDGSAQVGIGKKATTPSVFSSALGAGTHLVVVRYTFLASGNDQADLWVDPVAGSYGAASAPASLGSATGSSDPSALAYFQINTPSGAGPLLFLDEVRIATNWAGVTPTNGTVLPTYVPVVTNAWIAAGGFAMRGTNGSANSVYGILTATNPAGTWALLATNAFDAAGNFACTNPLVPGRAQQFYRLQVGNLPELPVAPAITSPPQNRTVGEGAAATFTVSASGTAPLRYQWYLQPGTLLTDKTNTTLTLSAVTTNLSGNGYFVIVTNLVGAVTSTVASLTVTSTPPTAPTITTQPQNLAVYEGADAAFTVAVTGTPPLRYQWYFDPGTPLAGATNSTLNLIHVQATDAVGYWVIVTNLYGAQTSVVATLTVNVAPTNGTLYVAPDGNDSYPGTLAEPFATLPKAISVVQPGQIIYLRGGSYAHSSTIRFTNSGTAGNPIQLLGYPGEWPVFNFSTQPYGAANRGFLIPTNCNWWVFKNFEIHHAGDNAIKVEGSHHRFEQLVLHHNGDTGIQIGFGHDDVNPGGQLAAFVEVINCDSYLNYDSDSNGGDADGFAAKMHCGQGIVFQGCRAWENSDDGWDLFETDYSIVISNCWTWKSGVAQGNGNGFKLGGNGAGGDSKGTHYAWNCVAFGHKVNGFTQNSHKDGNVVIHCLSFSNGSSGYNYFMEGALNSGKQNIFQNNVSIPRSGSNGGGFIADNSPVEQNNTWNLAVTASAADFADVTETAAKAARQPDGSLPTGFARLVSGSDFIDKGVNLGRPFNGAAPDLGPYEYAP